MNHFLIGFIFLCSIFVIIIEMFRSKRKNNKEINNYTKWYNKRIRDRKIAFRYKRINDLYVNTTKFKG